MAEQLTVRITKEVNAPASRVWEALTDPAQIKQYLFDTNTVSDFKEGSPISYSGVHEGKEYEDKGKVIEAVPNKLLHTTYFSPMTGKEDKEENYKHIIYKLDEENGKTRIEFSQDNIADEKELKQMEENWEMVLGKMKKVVEQ